MATYVVKKQYLTLPLKECRITAGFMSPKYYDYWGFNHYGYDFTGPIDNKKETVYSSGYGVVMKAGYDTVYGYIIAIYYPNCYNSKTKKVINLMARYMHMDSIVVKDGDQVKPNQPIGVMGNRGTFKCGIHLHIEFDINIKDYTHSGSVKGGTILNGGLAATLQNPYYYLNIGISQTLTVHPYAYCNDDQKTFPKAPTQTYELEEKVIMNDDSQKLILPINNARLTASISDFSNGISNAKVNPTDPYLKKFKFTHYGIDMVSVRGITKMYASGNGVVIATGYDNLFGNVCIIKYPKAYNHETKKAVDIIFRYFHMASIAVKAGDAVTIDTAIGCYGRTGKYGTGAHLHLEVDSDTKLYAFTAGLKTSSNIIKKGNSKTMFNPCHFFHLKITRPELQSIIADPSKYSGYRFAREEDILMIPQIN